MLVFAAACGPDGTVDLWIDLRTDFVPGVEFTAVRVELSEDGRSEEHLAGAGDYLSGQRVAELQGLSARTTRELAVELVDDGGRVVARRDVLVQHQTDLVVTVVLTRDCRDVSCPSSPTSSATSCLGGECVDPTCVEGDEETCNPGCSVDADCAPMAPCARPVCSSGVCLYGADDSCGADEYCDPNAGCVPREPSACMPTLDVTYDLLTGSTDGEGLTAQPRDVALAFDGDEAWLAFATIASPDVVNIGSIYAAPIRCDGTFGTPQMLIFDADRPSIALAGDRLLVGCRAMGAYPGSESIRFVDPDTGLPLGPAIDPDGIGSIEDVVPRGALFDVFATTSLGVGDRRLHVFTLDGDGALVGEPRTPMPETGTAEQESANGAEAAEGAAVVFLRSLPDSALGLADEVIVEAPFSGGPIALDTSSPRTNRTPGLALSGDVAWVTVQEGPNSSSPANQIATLHSVTASGATRHELPVPPDGAGHYDRGLFEGPPGEMLHVWTRGYESDPTELLVRRLDVQAATPTAGPEIVVPTVDAAAAVSAVHVGAGTYLMVWSEHGAGSTATLRARFVRP